MQEKTLADFMKQAPAVLGVKKIIAVACAKGGVGKSSVTANLAVTLQKKGLNIAVVDADIYGPSQAHLMNLQGKVEQKDGLILPKISNGVKCISIASIIDFEAAGVWRGPMVTKILQQLIRSVNWKNDAVDVDIMLLDMPPGTGDVYLSIAERFPLNGVILVSTPQSLALIDLVKSINCFEKLKIPILGLIENMSYLEINGEKHYIFGQEAAQEFSKELKIKFFGKIPLIPEIAKLSDAKKLAVVESKEIAKIFEEIAKNLEV